MVRSPTPPSVDQRGFLLVYLVIKTIRYITFSINETKMIGICFLGKVNQINYSKLSDECQVLILTLAGSELQNSMLFSIYPQGSIDDSMNSIMIINFFQ